MTMDANKLKRTSALFVAFFSAFAVAQVAQPEPSEIPPLTVTFPFFVLNDHGNSIDRLDQSHLSMRDNKRPPQSVIAIHSPRELPVRLGLLIDTSKSEGSSGLYQPAIKAAVDFLNNTLSGGDDKAFLSTFSSELKGTNFLTKDKIGGLITSTTAVDPNGGTLLFDAIYVACKERLLQDSTQPARRVLVVVTDGGDNMSHANHKQSIAAAQEAGAAIFVIGTSQNADDRLDSGRLQEFADKTGGRAFLHLKRQDLPKAFEAISEQIGEMWTITFVPATVSQPDYHSIQLKLASDKKIKLRAPEGYYLHQGNQK
jgi:Ca-activated chloride channel family protein